jgi:hypothetical protein
MFLPSFVWWMPGCGFKGAHHLHFSSSNRTNINTCIYSKIIGWRSRPAVYSQFQKQTNTLSIVLLPGGWIQEIERMWLDHLTHSLFLTWTRKSHHLQIIYYNIYTSYNAWSTHPLLPTAPSLLTWRTSFLARVGEYPSTLVPGLLTTAPPFACSHTLQIELQYLHRRHQQHQSSLSGTSIDTCYVQ